MERKDGARGRYGALGRWEGEGEHVGAGEEDGEQVGDGEEDGEQVGDGDVVERERGRWRY